MGVSIQFGILLLPARIISYMSETMLSSSRLQTLAETTSLRTRFFHILRIFLFFCITPEVTSCFPLLSVENRAIGRAAAEARNLWLARVRLRMIIIDYHYRYSKYISVARAPHLYDVR